MQQTIRAVPSSAWSASPHLAQLFECRHAGRGQAAHRSLRDLLQGPGLIKKPAQGGAGLQVVSLSIKQNLRSRNVLAEAVSGLYPLMGLCPAPWLAGCRPSSWEPAGSRFGVLQAEGGNNAAAGTQDAMWLAQASNQPGTRRVAKACRDMRCDTSSAKCSETNVVQKMSTLCLQV